jgi:hypothetical protein
MKRALRQRHDMANDAIAASTVEDDAATPFRIPQLVREWLCNGTLGNAEVNQPLVTICHTVKSPHDKNAGHHPHRRQAPQ